MAPSVARAGLANLVYGYLGLALVFLQGILLVPLYLHYLPTDLYGAWLATGNILAWAALLDPGLNKVIQQKIGLRYGSQADASDQLGLWLLSGVRVAIAFSVTPLVLLPYSSELIRLLLDLPPGLEVIVPCFRLGVLGTTLTLLSFIPSAVNLGLQESRVPGLSALLGGVAAISSTLILLAGGWGLAALPSGIIVRGATSLLINLPSAYRLCSGHDTSWSFLHAKAYLGDSLYTLLSRIAEALSANVDSWIVLVLFDPAAVASYALTKKAADIIQMVSQRFATALLPQFARLYGEGDSAQIFLVVQAALRLVGCFAIMCLFAAVVLNNSFVLLWVGPAFYCGDSLTILFALAAGLAIHSSFWFEIAFAGGAVRPVALSRTAEGVIRVLLQFFLASRLGLAGLPLGACLSSVAITTWIVPSLVSRSARLPRLALYPLVAGYLGVLTTACAIAAHLPIQGRIVSWKSFLLVTSGYGLVCLAMVYPLAKTAWKSVECVGDDLPS